MAPPRTTCSTCSIAASSVPGGLLACDACLDSHDLYCGRACQRQGWAAHKPRCAIVKRLRVARALQEAGLECSGLLVNVPLTFAECSDEDEELNYKLIDRLDELDDVSFVEHNMAVTVAA